MPGVRVPPAAGGSFVSAEGLAEQAMETLGINLLVISLLGATWVDETDW